MLNKNKVFLKIIALTLLFTSSLNAFDFKFITLLFSKNKITAGQSANNIKCLGKFSSFISKRPKTVIAFSAIALISIAGFIWYKLNIKKSNEVRKLDEENFINLEKGENVIKTEYFAKKGLNRYNMTSKEQLKEVNLKKEELLEKIGPNRAKELIEISFVDAYKNDNKEDVIILLKDIDINRAKELINKTGINCDYESYWESSHITLKMANLLISLGANVDEIDTAIVTPLSLVYNNKPELAKLLIESVTIKSVNKSNYEGETALFCACDKGYLEVVRELLKHKDIEVNKADNFGRSPLCIACENGYLEIVKELLKHENIDVNKADGHEPYSDLEEFGRKFPLYIACDKNNLELVRELLKHKNIDINKTNIGGISALELAFESSDPEIVKLLLENGSNFKLKNLTYIKELLEWLGRTNTSKLENLNNISRYKKILKYLNLVNQFDLWKQSNLIFDVPEEEKNNVDLCEFKNRLLTSKREKGKLKFPKILDNKRGLSRFSDCRIRTID